MARVRIATYEYVIARFDVDGFRIDTLRYLRGGMPRLFGNAMGEFSASIGKKNFFTFGEVWSSEEDIARFIGRNTQEGTDLVGVDAALDYPLFDVLKPLSKGLPKSQGGASPTDLAAIYQKRKTVEQHIISSHGDATRFFVTFVDNHDVKERIRYVDPAQPHRYDDQVSLAISVLAALPGIPCLYYGDEQGLSGHGNDEAVREAMWGAGAPGFDTSSPFYTTTRAILGVRAGEATLRYGRFYPRPVSGDGAHFGLSPYAPGALAFSRILADEEVVVVADTDPDNDVALDVIVDLSLHASGEQSRLLYSNKATPQAPNPVRPVPSAAVAEADGSQGQGPLNVVHVALAPMEVQIIGFP